MLADGPDLAPEAVERVIASWRAEGGALVAASYGGERGHPLLVAREAWGDDPRRRAARRSTCGSCRATTSAHPGDVDTPATCRDASR